MAQAPVRRLVPLDDAPPARRLVPLDEPPSAGSGPAGAAPPSPVTPSAGAAPLPAGEGGAPQLPGSTLGTVGQTIIDSGAGVQSGAMLDWDDELAAGMVTPIETVVRWFQGKGFSPSESYNEALKFYRDQKAGSEARSPIANTVGQVVGSVALPGSAAKAGLSPLAAAGARGAGLGTRVAAAAAEGAAYSGLQAAGDAEENKLAAGLKAAPIGAATGGILERVVGGRQIKQAATKATQSAADMASDVSGRYAVAKGAHMKANEFNKILLDSANKAKVLDPNGTVLLEAGRISKKAHPVASEVQQMLKNQMVRGGRGARVPTLEQTQDIAMDIMKKQLPKASGADRDMVQAIGERLMKSVDAPPATAFVNPQKGVAAAETLKGAHDISRRGKITKKLEQKVGEAIKSAAGRKVNEETLFNDTLRKFLASDAAKALTKTERADLEKLRIGGLGRLVRAGQQAVEPGWMASIASTVFHPFLAAASLTLKASGAGARRKGRKLAASATQEALRRLSSGVSRKDFLKTVKPVSSPFAAAITGQANDRERDR
jgi:hypothetical protein